MTLSVEEIAEIRSQIGDERTRLESEVRAPGVVPLKVACHWSSCQHGRHSLDHFRSSHRGEPGTCADCGKRVVMLDPPTGRAELSAADVPAVISALKQELIRAHYWVAVIDLKAYNQAVRMGRDRLLQRASEEVRKALLTDSPYQGRGAPLRENIIAYAQHATGSCCRKCASYWYGFSRSFDKQPTESQVNYVISIVHAYLDLRLPDLPADGHPAPRVMAASMPDVDEVARLEQVVLDHMKAHGDPSGLLVPIHSSLEFAHQRDATGGYVMFSRIGLRDLGAA